MDRTRIVQILRDSTDAELKILAIVTLNGVCSKREIIEIFEVHGNKDITNRDPRYNICKRYFWKPMTKVSPDVYLYLKDKDITFHLWPEGAVIMEGYYKPRHFPTKYIEI